MALMRVALGRIVSDPKSKNGANGVEGASKGAFRVDRMACAVSSFVFPCSVFFVNVREHGVMSSCSHATRAWQREVRID